MTIQINISGTTIYNVSNDVIIDSIELGKRADYSFEVGSFKMFTSQITKNIPPYSFCRITDNNYVSTDYLISSEATAYFTNGKWMHDCKLLSLEAIMECYILGAKTFSLADSPNDSVVFTKLKALINQSAGMTKFTAESTTTNLLSTFSNEYTFPDGTSFYEVIKTIANKNNLKFELVLNSFGYGENSYFYINYYQNTNNEFELLEPKLVSFKLMQDGNNYCKYLQCASADIVDRANPTTFKNLTIRATNGVVVSEDTAELVLPTRVEGITKLNIYANLGYRCFRIVNNGNYSLTTLLSTNYINAFNPTTASDVNNYFDLGSGSYIQTEAHTLYDWCNNVTNSTYPASRTYWQWLDEYFNLSNRGYSNEYFVVKKYDNNNTVFVAMVTDNNNDENYNEYNMLYYFKGRNQNITPYLLEDSYFNSLDVAEQPHYLTYKSGDNKIANLNASYKNDLWNMLFGTAVKGFFDRANDFIENSNNVQLKYVVYFYDEKETPFNATFNVECVPITNPMLVDEKNTTPINETSFKAMTRTYQMGDSNGLLVDFKALSNDIDKQNDTLGDVEAILELDADVYYDDDGNDELYSPEPNHKITFDYKNTSFTFYISSMATRYTNNRKTYQLNLSRTPYKIADAIGVDYQFNPTWLPLDNIIERALYFEITQDNFKSTYIDSSSFFLKLTINNISSINYDLYFSPVVMKNNGYWICYCEMQDNIVAGMSTIVVDSTKKSIDNVKYVDENGAFTYCTLSFVAGSGLSTSESFELPKITSHVFQHTLGIATNRTIHKDSREKLTFTIKVNDSLI